MYKIRRLPEDYHRNDHNSDKSETYHKKYICLLFIYACTFYITLFYDLYGL